MTELVSRGSVKLNPKQLFANDYGQFSEGVQYVSRHGGLKPIYSAPLYGGIFLAITGIVCFVGSSSLGTSTFSTIIKALAFFLIALAVAALITYITVYISKYLPNYRNWYASLPSEAIERIPS